MDSIDDDFGELYADVELQVTSAINNDLGFSVDVNKVENNEVDNEVVDDDDGDDDDDDEDDDDFDVVVNDDDFDARNGGGGGGGEGGGGGGGSGSEFNRGGSSRIRVENGEMEQSGCGYGGERATLGLGNVSNMQYKYIRQYGSALTSNKKSATFGGDDREDVGYIQHGKSNLGRVGPSYAGYAPGLGESGNGFWLPWYRTILDVDIDSFSQKPWTLPGADITNYFNFGFDEESWKRYCQLMGQRRQQTFQNQFNENSRTKLENEAAGCENIKAEVNGHERTTALVSEFSNEQFNRQVGRPILVEDSYAERLPSMSARGPRYRDSDVVIEITVQDSERSSNVGEEKSDEVTKTECKISDGCGFENDGPKVEKKADSKHCEMGMELEDIASPRASLELKRSCESATVSSHMLQASSSQGKMMNLESDTLESEEGAVISKEHVRAVHTPNTSMKDADRNSTETNPCVADIDLSYSDHIQSSPTPSDSDDNSKASVGGHHRDFRRIEIGRSSSELVMDERQVLEDNHYLSRKNQRDAFRIKSTGGKYRTRARSPIEEDRKHFRRRIHRHSELDSYSIKDDNCLVKIEGHFYHRKQLNDHHHRNIRRPHGTFDDDDDWPSCREKKSSLGHHDKLFVEKQFQGSRMRDPHHQDPWKSKDESHLHFPREWDEEFIWERKMRRMYESVEEEWYLHERKCSARDEKLKLHMEPHSSSKHSSLVDRERWNSGSDYYDFPKHHLSLDYSHSDTPPLDRYARSYPLNDREEEYLYSEYEYDRRLQHFEKEVARSDRVDRYLENPSLDLDYPRCNRIGDEHANWPRSPHDYHDMHASYAERRHDFTVERYGVDGSMVHKYRRCDRYIAPWKRRDDRWPLCDRKDAYGGQNNVRDHEDAYCFEKMQSVAWSKGMNSVEEGQSSKCFNDFYSDDMHDSFKGAARHKWHGVKGGFGRGGMSMHAQSMKHKQRLAKCGDGKSCDVSSLLPTRVDLKHSASWCRDSMVARHVVREGKLTGKCTKVEHDGKRDAPSIADRSVQKQQKWQPQVDHPVTKVTGKNITFDIQTLQKNKLPAMKHLASDLKEGQIPTKGAHSEIRDGKKSGHLAHNASHLYNENRILETIAKMEKRRERFKEPILVNKDTGSDPKPDDTVAVTAESKQQRPARKRRWGGN